MIPFSRPSEWLYLEGTCHDVVHTWSNSCVQCNIYLTLTVCYEGLKLYLPLYLVSEIVRRWSLLAALKGLPHILPRVLRSSMFLGCNLGGTLFFICVLRRLIGRFYFYSSVMLPSFLGTTCAILVEKKSRRAPLTGYVATVAIELLYSLLKQRNVIPVLPYGEVLIFSLATAVLLHKARTSAGGDVVTSFLRFLLSPQLPKTLTSLFQHSILDNRLSHIAEVGVWTFLLGYLLQTITSLLSQGTRLFKEKGELKRRLMNPQSIKFAMFLASLTAGYKLVSSVLYYFPLSRDVRLLLAGLTAGLSMLFYRSNSLSLYVAWKALEVVYSQGVSRGWLRYLPHGDALIYGLSSALLIHGWFYESHNMRWTFWNFYRTLTWGKLLKLNFTKLDRFGTGASTRPKEWELKHAQHQIG